MKQDQDKQGIGRRAFLRGGLFAGVAGAAGAVAATAGATPAAAAGDPADPRDKADARYRETEHVRRVYDLARF